MRASDITNAIEAYEDALARGLTYAEAAEAVEKFEQEQEEAENGQTN